MAGSAFGTELQIGDGGGPEAFVKVGGVTNISGMGYSQDFDDSTDHDSTGAVEEVVGTIIRTGEVTLAVHIELDDTEHLLALAGLESRALVNFELVYPIPLVSSGGTQQKHTFAALITGWNDLNMPHDGKGTFQIRLKPSGPLTLEDVV